MSAILVTSWAFLPNLAIAQQDSSKVASQVGTTLKSGIDLENLSRSITPGTDFFDYVNDGWLKKTEIPSDQSNYGTFTALDDATQDAVKALIEESSNNLEQASGPARQVGALYRSYMDTQSRNERGIRGLKKSSSRSSRFKASRTGPG